jgi:protein-S-isoprenylcysteine O-methyltransferase Ste14
MGKRSLPAIRTDHNLAHSLMTINLLVIYLLAIIYLYMGSLHWERRLVSQFGDEYREYQKRVNRIIPKFWGHR